MQAYSSHPIMFPSLCLSLLQTTAELPCYAGWALLLQFCPGHRAAIPTPRLLWALDSHETETSSFHNTAKTCPTFSVSSFSWPVQIFAFLISSSDSLSERHLCGPRACLLLAHYSQHPEYPHTEANHSASTNLSQENLLRGWDHWVFALAI